MEGPVKALGRVALTAKEMRLPRGVVGDAGHLVQFRLIRDRVCGVRRRGGENQVDLFIKDQFLSNRRCAVRTGLAVLDDEFDVIGFARDFQTTGKRALELVQHKRVGFRENGQRACLR